MDLSRYFDADTGEIDFVIAQAEGMISGQAGIPMACALIALDDYCRAHGDKACVAAQVTERLLRFDG